MATQVLLVEDDPDIATALVMALGRDDYVVAHVGTGLAAVDHVANHSTQVVLLDLGLPDIDGLEVCRRIRAGGYHGAVLILTARGGELDRVVGLDVGADDYLSKPFSLSELLARIRATLRRGWALPADTATGPTSGQPARAEEADGDGASSSGLRSASGSGHAAPATLGSSTTSMVRMPSPSTRVASPTAAAADALTVDQRARRAFVGRDEVTLTAKEFDVLALLDTERGAVVTREQLMNDVWDENWFGSTKTLDATVGRLRQKLESAASPVRIATVRGVGFRLEDEPMHA